MAKLPLVFIFFISACSSKPYIVDIEGKFNGGRNQVYIVSHGWHTGFVIPAADIQDELPELRQRFPNTKNIELGWGDKGFYQSKEITSSLTIQAIFWPSESVIHAVAVPQNVQQYFFNSDMALLCLSDEEYSSLLKFISNSFSKNGAGDIMPQKKGIYGDSQFYKGVGDYYLMNTCNKWTAKGLRSAGLNISPMFKLTANSIMSSLSRFSSRSIKNCSAT